MIDKINHKKEVIFHWLLALSAITIVFPDYSLNSNSIILLGLFWLLMYSGFSDKKKYLKLNYKKFFATSAFFIISLIGLLYSNDFNSGLNELYVRLPMLVFPIVIFSTNLTNDSFLFSWKYFSYATLTTSILALFSAFYLKYNHLGDYFFYDRFSILTNKHATYYAMFISISILFFVYQLIHNKRHFVFNIFFVVFLVYTLLIVSNRISFIALAISLLVLFFGYLKNYKLKLLFSTLTIISIFILFQSQNLQKRFSTNNWDKHQRNDIELRSLLWKLAGEEILDHPIIGMGTGSNRKKLYQKYLDNQYQIAYEQQYNAHNQFIDMTLDFGIIGLIIFIISMMYIFFQIRHNYWKTALFSIFIVFMFTEVIFNRHSGITTFTLFVSLMLINDTLLIRNDKSL